MYVHLLKSHQLPHNLIARGGAAEGKAGQEKVRQAKCTCGAGAGSRTGMQRRIFGAVTGPGWLGCGTSAMAAQIREEQGRSHIKSGKVRQHPYPILHAPVGVDISHCAHFFSERHDGLQ